MALSDLLVAKTKAQQLTTLLAALKAAGFPVTAWNSGDVARTLVEIDAEALADLTATLVAVTRGGFVDLATGAWLDLLAENLFGLERRAAVSAAGPVLLVDAAGTGPHTIAAGDVWASSTSGKRFTNSEAGTLPQNGALVLAMRAESPGDDWNVDPGEIDTLLTSLPGVEVSNWFGAVEQAGAGLGTVVPVPNGTPTAGDDVVVKITTGGALGVATFRYSLDGGSTFSGADVATAAVVSDPAGEGFDLRFSDSAGVFVLDDTYTFSRSSWLTVAGTDEEADEALRTRCQDRWADAGPAATAGWYRNRAFEADETLTRVLASPDDATPGQVNVVVATADGAPSASVVSAVQAYLDERRPLTVDVVVAAVAEVAVELTGTVFYDPTVSQTVEADVAQALLDLQQALEIGGQSMGGGTSGLPRAQIIEAIMAVTGVVNVALTTPAADTALAADELVDLTNSLTFTSV